jgi:hypothetical protein
MKRVGSVDEYLRSGVRVKDVKKTKNTGLKRATALSADISLRELL